MFVNKKRKKGVSILISYVLLVTLALALAAVTYFFILPYATNPLPEEKCPDGVSIIIESYSCHDNLIDITVKNTGRYNITGFFIKIINRSDSLDLEYLLEEKRPQQLNPIIDVLPVGSESLTVLGINYEDAHIEKIIIVPYKFIKGDYATICSEAITRIDVPENDCFNI